MNTGTVKWFDVTKGYGFITPSDGGGDVFVHFRDMHYSVEKNSQGHRVLHEGDSVEFEEKMGDRGMKAVEVRKVNA